MGLKARPEISGQIQAVQKMTGLLLAIFIVIGSIAAIFCLELLVVFLPFCLIAGWAFVSAMTIKISYVEGSHVIRREIKTTIVKPMFGRKTKKNNRKNPKGEKPEVKTRRDYWVYIWTVHGDQYRITVSPDDYKKMYHGRSVMLYSLTSKVWCPYMMRVYRQYALPL